MDPPHFSIQLQIDWMGSRGNAKAQMPTEAANKPKGKENLETKISVMNTATTCVCVVGEMVDPEI